MDKKDFIKWTENLQSSYQPSPETLEAISQVDLVAIVGPTGVGKSVIIENLGLPYVISDASREMRSDEEPNKNYHYRSDYLNVIKDIKEGNYVQFVVSKYYEFYGTRKDSYPDEGPCVMAVIASAMPMFRKLGFRSVKSIYIMPPGYVEWIRRIGTVRSTDLLARISEARESILLAVEDPDYKFVLNDNVELAVSEVKAIIKGEAVDEHRAQLAYDTANILLERVGDEPE